MSCTGLGSWADEMEDAPMPTSDSHMSYAPSARRDYGSNNMSSGMSYERRDNFMPREQLPFPTQPPYTAHLANLSFDVTQDDVQHFFANCDVSNVRIVEDKMDRKPKGFGYVEFNTPDGLRSALALSGSNLAGRQVRISVADPPKDRPDQSRDFSDWSRKGPLPDLPQNNRRTSDRAGFGRNFNDNMSDAGSDRGGRRAFGGESDGKPRDFSNWERRGPLSPAPGQDLSLRSAGRQASKGEFSRNSPSWGEGRSQDGSRPPRRDLNERPAVPERAPTAAELDNQWRSNMRPDAPPPKSPEPQVSTPSSPAPATTRPRLNLQKRTVAEATPQTSSATDSKASPFGAARPVDTAAKEREVAEKREIAIREKREAEEKAKAEKVEKAEEKRAVREKESAETATKQDADTGANENQDEKEKDNENENEESKPAAPKYEVLRRQVSESNDMVADEEHEEEAEEAEETVTPETDKAVKPKEITRDAPVKQNGSWREGRGSESKPAEVDSETAALEADGWSTVSKPNKNNKNRRNQPTRAIAS